MADDDQTLAEIMTGHVISLVPDETLRDAIEMFERCSFWAIPITDEHDHILAVVSFTNIRCI
jgi:CBS domain-containing protein